MSIRDQLAQLFRSSESRAQDRRMTAQEQARATSPEEEIAQREERRLSNMSGDDQAWEQAALQRHREAQDRLVP
jgi:hypothetical protein